MGCNKESRKQIVDNLLTSRECRARKMKFESLKYQATLPPGTVRALQCLCRERRKMPDMNQPPQPGNELVVGVKFQEIKSNAVKQRSIDLT